MRRATITIPDDLEADLDAFMRRQDPAPSLTRLVQSALRRLLAEKQREQALSLRMDHSAPTPRGPVRFTVAEHGSGETDVSIDHDRHFADKP